MSFKRQLNSYDKNFEGKRIERVDYIDFLKPLLKPKNIYTITHKKPTSITVREKHTDHTYFCKRKINTPFDDQHLTFILRYNKKGKLMRLYPPAQFSLDMDEQSFQKATKAMLEGDISAIKKRITGVYNIKKSGPIHRLSRDNILMRFGKPDQSGKYSMKYVYILETKSKTNIKSKTVLLNFSLDKTQKIQTIQLEFGSTTLKFSYK